MRLDTEKLKRKAAELEKEKVDSSAGAYGQITDRIATPPDIDRTGKVIQEETVVITNTELRELLKKAMMEGKMAGNLSNPENIETISQYNETGFDDEAVNAARRMAEKGGDLTHIQKALIRRFKQKKGKFDASSYITSDEVATHQYEKRVHGGN